MPPLRMPTLLALTLIALALPACESTPPTAVPVATPTPTSTLIPTLVPTPTSTLIPTLVPTPTSTLIPTLVPTPTSTLIPTLVPTPTSTLIPTLVPTPTSTLIPTLVPTPPPAPRPAPEADDNPLSEAEILATGQALMWTTTLPGAPADEVLHVSALRTVHLSGQSGNHRRESWIDDTNHRGLSAYFESDGSLISKTLVLGNQVFNMLDAGGRTTLT